MSKLSENHLHIVSFDIPVPVNYGGVIDVFYKLKYLSAKGIKIHLHCFRYGGRKPADILNKYCHVVHYYSRKSLAHDLTGNIPYIVNSRKDDQLIDNLMKDDYPVLFEGLHSCYYLSDSGLNGRIKIVRTHNIEHDYYANLAKTEKNYFKKLYFLNEARLLRDFEEKLIHADILAVISQNDYNYFSKKFSNAHIISAFHPNETVDILPGMGDYALYHGSLEVNENHHAAMFLVKEVFHDIPFKLIIAGNKPKRELLQAVENMENIEIRSGLSVEQIHQLVREAHINILPTFQVTGIKLKLLLALYQGRHCLVNTPMVVDTGLEDLCHIADTPEEMQKVLLQLMKDSMNESGVRKRKAVLMENGFMNDRNADILIEKIFE
jgi:hypothetical protein